MIRISDFRHRDVINVNDGRRLGVISDLELDLEKGVIQAIIIPPSSGLWGKITRAKDFIIPWDKIIKIGVDTILVDYSGEVEAGPATADL